MRWALFLLFVILFGHQNPVWAQEDSSGFEDHYDPFSDYSEFVEAEAEEADVNFFKNGRMLSVGANIGLHSMTGNMADYYTRDPMFGLYATYFFDMRFALQASANLTTHTLVIPEGPLSSSVRLTTLSLHAKYFFNTKNMTRSMGELNPFVIGGFSGVYRDTSNTNGILVGNDGARAFDIGGGVEYLFNHKRNSVGLTFMYQYADFNNEDVNVPDTSGSPTGVFLSGDIIFAMITLGINY